MRELHAGAERDLHEVRYVWDHDGVFVKEYGTKMMLFLNDKVPTARLALSNARAFCCNAAAGATRNRGSLRLCVLSRAKIHASPGPIAPREREGMTSVAMTAALFEI